MLTTRPQKTILFALVEPERAYDILDGGRAVAVVHYLKNKGGRIAIDGKQYSLVRGGGPSDEMLGQMLIRAVTGRQRIPATWTLTDPDGGVLASAENSKEGVAITHGEERFQLRKLKRSGQYQLFREGNEQPLCSTAGMSLPPEFGRLFQFFVLAIAIALVNETLDSSPAVSP